MEVHEAALACKPIKKSSYRTIERLYRHSDCNAQAVHGRAHLHEHLGREADEAQLPIHAQVLQLHHLPVARLVHLEQHLQMVMHKVTALVVETITVLRVHCGGGQHGIKHAQVCAQDLMRN